MTLPLSVVVPTHNRRAPLERLLDTLEGAAWLGTPFEVVVAVDGATDGTREMLARKRGRTRYPLHVVDGPQRGPGGARNAALRVAQGEIVLFLDDDVVPVADLIQRHLTAHQVDPHAAVMGPMLPPPRTPLAPWLLWEARTLRKQHDAMLAGAWDPTPRQFYTANASVRRAAIERAGGFDESYRRAEDVELARRLEDCGACFYYLPGAVVFHEPHRSFAAWLDVPYQYGQADVRMAREQERPTLEDAYREWGTRRTLNRLLPRLCVGHPRRLRAAVAALSRAIQSPTAARAPERVQLALCSALYNLRYWQGVADATGLGAAVWRGPTALATAPATVAALSAPSVTPLDALHPTDTTPEVAAA